MGSSSRGLTAVAKLRSWEQNGSLISLPVGSLAILKGSSCTSCLRARGQHSRRLVTVACRVTCVPAGYGKSDSTLDGVGQSWRMGEDTASAGGVAPPASQPVAPPQYTPAMQSRLTEAWNHDLDKGAVAGALATLGVR